MPAATLDEISTVRSTTRQTLEALLDHRLEPSGRRFEEFRATKIMDMPVPRFRKYRKTGFATPSGKVELSPSILGDLGFDPLPYHRPAPEPTAEYPYRVFSGVREDPFFQTGQRNIGVLRRRMPAPNFFVHPIDAARDGLVDGEWARLETEHGHVYAHDEAGLDEASRVAAARALVRHSVHPSAHRGVAAV